jgi:hypothetical protein
VTTKLNYRKRKTSALTVLEVLMLVFLGIMILGIVAPKLIFAEEIVKESEVKVNMRIAQVAAESYAADHDGHYPAEVDDAFKSYFPGGSCDGKTPAPEPPKNPFSGQREFPVKGSLTYDSAATRTHIPDQTGASAGQVVYVPQVANAQENRGYAILGTGGFGTAVPGATAASTTVLTNAW